MRIQETFSEDGYSFLFPEHGIQIVFERLNEDKRDGLQGEFFVEEAGPLNVFSYGRVSFMSSVSRNNMVKALIEASDGIEFPWKHMVDAACIATIKQWRSGTGIVNVREIDKTTNDQWILKPFLEDKAATVLFADGGTGKSFFALGMALTICTGTPIVGFPPAQTGGVLYLDYEANDPTFASRAEAICTGVGINLPGNLHYKLMKSSLKEAAPSLRMFIATHDIVAVIVDSMGMAKAGEIEGNEASKSTFEASRLLGTAVLFIDHIAKTAQGDARFKPFGGSYTHNLARMTWQMTKVEGEEDDKLIALLDNRKSNNGKLFARLCYEVQMDTDQQETLQAVKFYKHDPLTLDAVFTRLTTRDQILACMAKFRRMVTAQDIKDEMDGHGVTVGIDEIKTKLKKLTADKRVVRQASWKHDGTDGEPHWGLRAKREDIAPPPPPVLVDGDDDW